MVEVLTSNEAFKMRYLKEELARSLADEAAGRIEDFDSFFSDLIAGEYDSLKLGLTHLGSP